MKKFVMLVMCFAIMLCAVACDDIPEISTGENSKPEINVQEGTEAEFVELSIATKSDTCVDTEIGETLSNMEYPVIRLSENSSKDYPQLAKAIEKINAEEKTSAENAFEENIEMAKKAYDEKLSLYSGYTYETSVEVKRADSSALTLLYSTYTYTGGVHGYYGFYGRSIDVKTGKELKLTDVVTDVSALPELIKEQLEIYWSDLGLSGIENVDDIVKEPENVPWSLDYNGLTLYYNPYHLGSFAAGAQFVTLSYKDNPELFNGEYVSHPSEYAFQLDGATLVSEDVTGDGIFDKISVNALKDDEDYYIEKIEISVNEEILEDSEAWGLEARPVFIRTDKGCYLYVECPGENGYSDIICYKLGEKIERIGSVGCNISCKMEGEGTDMILFADAITNPKSFRLEHRVNNIGSYFGFAEYHVGENGMPVTDDVLFLTEEENELTLLRDLEVEKYDVSAHKIGDKITLKKGETLTHYATNDDKEEYFVLNDGTIVRLILDDGEKYPKKVDGVSVYDIFDNIFLAG